MVDSASTSRSSTGQKQRPSLGERLQSAFSWVSTTASFLLRGRKVPVRTIDGLNAGWMSSQSDLMVELGGQLANGSMTLKDFQCRAGRIVADINAASFALGAGGWKNVNRQARQRLEQVIQAQLYAGHDTRTGQHYGLRLLAQDVQKGQVSEAQLKNRLRMFAQSGKRAYFEGQRFANISSSTPYGYRVLGDVEHCTQCPEYAALPPQRADQLIMPTEQCDCMNQCKCRIVWVTLEEAIKKGAVVESSS